MMHSVIFMLAFGIAWLLRLSWAIAPGHSMHNASRGILLLVTPSLFVLMTAISIVWMGPFGYDMSTGEGWFCHTIAILFLAYATSLAGRLHFKNYRLLSHLKTLPTQTVQGVNCRILNTPLLFIAQCGVGATELVMSRGLLEQLTPEQLEAMLAHEQAHLHYNDMFWYALMSWFKQLLPFFPCEHSIWNYLVLVRELRADRWATQSVDPLVLAESLLAVVRQPLFNPSKLCTALMDDVSAQGLELRVKALIEGGGIEKSQPSIGAWIWMIAACCPLLIVPFHH